MQGQKANTMYPLKSLVSDQAKGGSSTAESFSMLQFEPIEGFELYSCFLCHFHVAKYV